MQQLRGVVPARWAVRALLVSMFFGGDRAEAGQKTLSVAADTYLSNKVAGNNFGAATSIYTGTNCGGTPSTPCASTGAMRGVVRFTMPSSLRGRATISRARLQLRTQGLPVGTPAAATVSLYRMGGSSVWTEGSGVGNPMAGTACASAGFGATWNLMNCTGNGWSYNFSGSASSPAACRSSSR